MIGPEAARSKSNYNSILPPGQNLISETENIY